MKSDFNVAGRFYKYRSLENLERFFSIIIDKKLYGALFSEMNDPMEGYYQYNPYIDKTLLRNIIDGKTKTYICSLSRRGDIGLMWTHYANENKGCCIEVEITSKTWDEVPVVYSMQMPEINEDTTVEDVLKVKAKMWEYEQETRFLSCKWENGKDRPSLTVRIKRIFIGCNVERSKFTQLRKIIGALDKDIEVIKMHKDWIDYGYQH